MFIREVRHEKDIFFIELNDNNNRYNSDISNGINVDIRISIDWLGENLEVLDRSEALISSDYKEIMILTFKTKSKFKSDNALVEIRFDDLLMYKNIIKTSEFSLI